MPETTSGIIMPPAPTMPPPAAEVAGSHPSLNQLRHNPEAIRHAFETGEFPYKSRLGTKSHEDQMAKLQVELLKVQNWVMQVGVPKIEWTADRRL